MDTFSATTKRWKFPHKLVTNKAILKQSAEVGDGDYGEAVQGSTVANESPASSEPHKAEPWLI
jgi:hypothetical protein